MQKCIKHKTIIPLKKCVTPGTILYFSVEKGGTIGAFFDHPDVLISSSI